MTEIDFMSLALQGYHRIPLNAEAFADLETPLSLYLKLVGRSCDPPGSAGATRRAAPAPPLSGGPCAGSDARPRLPGPRT